MAFAHVVLTGSGVAHLDTAYTYRVPEGMPVEIGSVVRAPVRGRSQPGVVVALLAEPDVARTQPVRALLGPGLPPDVVHVAHTVAEHYLSSLGEALDAALPPRIASEEPVTQPAGPHPAVRADLAWLERYRGGAALRDALGRDRHAAFSWRPQANDARGAAIVSLVRATLTRGRGALVLVPEVRVDGDVADALERLGARVAWLGSDRTARDRYRAWLALRNGSADVAVGGRAAVFAPVKRLGLVVVDDEAHVSYKERRAPRFHARPVAWQRARDAGAVFVAVGVPPSVEVFHAIERGLLASVVPSRGEELRVRPPVLVVDRTKSDERHTPVSRTLTSIRNALGTGRRAVVVIHRVGDESRTIATRVMRNAGASSPVRLDARKLAKDPDAFARACSEADLIVASPVIAKDLPLANVGCVAVLDADAALASPEFRAAEEAFATWWRAGRWLGPDGAFVIETQQPRHPAIAAIARWDPTVMLRAEAERRDELGYPPFAALVRIAADPETALRVITEVSAAAPDAEVLGPTEGPGGHIVAVRSRDRSALIAALGPLAARWRSEGTSIRVDVDPRDLLR